MGSALRAVSDAVLAVASQQSVDEVLQGLVERARELAGARYAALGVPDGDGGFSRFLVAGMSDELIATLGPLPRTHGMLGAMLDGPAPFRTRDIHDDPRFRGWWPAGHPDMRSFLGVPIVAPEGVIGAFYLTEKEGAERLRRPTTRRSSSCSPRTPRSRSPTRACTSRAASCRCSPSATASPLELHDVVSQKLFCARAGRGVGGDAARPRRARAGRARSSRGCRRSRARRSTSCARSSTSCARPTSSATGCAVALRKHVEVLGRLHGVGVDVAIDADRRRARPRPRPRGPAHRPGGAAQRPAPRGAPSASPSGSRPTTAGSCSRSPTTARGFDPGDAELRSRHLGLTSMEERARAPGRRADDHARPRAGARPCAWRSPRG